MKKKKIFITLFSIISLLLINDKVYAEESYSCPDGYGLNGKKCTAWAYPENDSCPSGYSETKIEDYTCVFDTSVTKSCPIGFMESNGSCITSTDMPDNGICPENYMKVGDNTEKCFAFSEMIHSCPDGFAESGDRCVAYANYENGCPENYNKMAYNKKMCFIEIDANKNKVDDSKKNITSNKDTTNKKSNSKNNNSSTKKENNSKNNKNTKSVSQSISGGKINSKLSIPESIKIGTINIMKNILDAFNNSKEKVTAIELNGGFEINMKVNDKLSLEKLVYVKTKDSNGKWISTQNFKVTLSWNTFNNKIVKVNQSGIITAVDTGSTIIYVSTENGKSSAIKVNVTKDNQIKSFKVTKKTSSIKINSKAVTVSNKSKFDGSAYIETVMEKTATKTLKISCTSSDESILKIYLLDNIVLDKYGVKAGNYIYYNGFKEGTATIKCTINNDVSTSFKVTVKK